MKAETHILLALFKSTVEQSTALTNQYKQKAKHEFIIWQKQGFKLLESLEKANIIDEEYLNNITDIYHNINLEIKKNINDSKYFNKTDNKVCST